MPHKLLIVDDSRVSRMMIRGRAMASEPGWAILEAANGADAIATVEKEEPDFITMDVNMPGLSGFEVVAQLRASGCQARIVLLTGNILESSRERAESLGVHFVQKPATEVAIQQAIDYFNASQQPA